MALSQVHSAGVVVHLFPPNVALGEAGILLEAEQLIGPVDFHMAYKLSVWPLLEIVIEALGW